MESANLAPTNPPHTVHNIIPAYPVSDFRAQNEANLVMLFKYFGASPDQPRWPR